MRNRWQSIDMLLGGRKGYSRYGGCGCRSIAFSRSIDGSRYTCFYPVDPGLRAFGAIGRSTRELRPRISYAISSSGQRLSFPFASRFFSWFAALKSITPGADAPPCHVKIPLLRQNTSAHPRPTSHHATLPHPPRRRINHIHPTFHIRATSDRLCSRLQALPHRGMGRYTCRWLIWVPHGHGKSARNWCSSGSPIIRGSS